MNKLLITLTLILFPVLSYGYGWDEYTRAVYFFEGNGNDDMGVYNLTAIGTPTYQTDQVYQGSFALYTASHDNTFRLPDTLIAYLATQTQFTIECQMYNSLSGGEWQPLFCANWYGYAANYKFAFIPYYHSGQITLLVHIMQQILWVNRVLG